MISKEYTNIGSKSSAIREMFDLALERSKVVGEGKCLQFLYRKSQCSDAGMCKRRVDASFGNGKSISSSRLHDFCRRRRSAGCHRGRAQ